MEFCLYKLVETSSSRSIWQNANQNKKTVKAKTKQIQRVRTPSLLAGPPTQRAFYRQNNKRINIKMIAKNKTKATGGRIVAYREVSWPQWPDASRNVCCNSDFARRWNFRPSTPRTPPRRCSRVSLLCLKRWKSYAAVMFQPPSPKKEWKIVRWKNALFG